MGFTNYHGHTFYCDGKGTPAEYLEAALQQQMPAYGFSSHAPLPYDIAWTMKAEEADAYVREIKALRTDLQHSIEIYLGMEVDYIPHVAGPGHERIQRLGLDYTIGSVHFVGFFEDGRPWEIDGTHQVFMEGLQQIFKGDIRQAIERYYALIRQMITEDPPHIIGHLDKIKIQSEEGKLFSEKEDWYQHAVEQTLQLIKESGLIVEVNTRGIYKKKSKETYPSPSILKRMKALDIPIMLNADAHHPREITSCFEETAGLLLKIGYTHCRVLLQGQWQDIKLTTKGLDYA